MSAADALLATRSLPAVMEGAELGSDVVDLATSWRVTEVALIVDNPRIEHRASRRHCCHRAGAREVA